MEKIESFKPIIDDNSRVLILGSIPGVESLKKGQYYGHLQNHFWTIIFTILNKKLDSCYDIKVSTLLENRIALWDVIYNCQRKGSLDANIKYEEINDITSLLEEYPNIRFIAFNGGKAFSTFKKYIGLEILEEKEIAYKKMPSTSPIPGRNIKNIEEKIYEWNLILEYI